EDSLQIAHEVVGSVEGQRVDGDAFVDGASVFEVVRFRVVVQQRKAPAVVAHIIDAAEAPKPLEVPRGRRIEETFPLVPQCLRVPVHSAVREPARDVEAEDTLVAIAGAARLAGDAGRGALLAGQRKKAEAGPANGDT